MKLPKSEIFLHPFSFWDPNGQLFWWDGQLYRAITAEGASICRDLFKKNVVQRLIQLGLIVETELTSLEVEGYELVLRHRVIPFVSYPYEWSAAMLKDAALLIIDLEIELTQHGFTLQDAHPWNILFDGAKPIYVDFGSITPLETDNWWPPYDEFCRYFFYPLYLMAEGHSRIARWLLHDFDQGVLESDIIALNCRPPFHSRIERLGRRLLPMARQCVPGSFHPVMKKMFALAKSAMLKSSPTVKRRLDFLYQVKREVEEMEFPLPQTKWSDYYDGFFPSFSPSDDWTAKHVSAHQALDNLRASSVLDIGSGRGWYAQLAALRGSQVVAFDVDETCITQLYQDSKEKKLPILPLIMDFKNPSPGYGLCNQWLAPATERLKCDMVLALALVHHLVFKQHLNVDQIVDGLSIFSKRWLLVEFIPRDDRYVREWWSEKFSWYTLDNFIGALKKRFHDVRILPSYPETRVLLLCEK